MTISKKKVSAEKLLTEVELELMGILWKMNGGSVAEVMEKLPEERKLATTSVSTILRILEQKGVLKAKKEGRGHVYLPLVLKSDYEAKTVRHVVDKVFDGTPTALVRQLLNSGGLSDQDLAEIKKMIQEMGA